MHWSSLLCWHDTCFSEDTRVAVVYTHSHDGLTASSRYKGSLDDTLNKIVHSLLCLAQATTDIQPLKSFRPGNEFLHPFSAPRTYRQPLSFDLSTWGVWVIIAMLYRNITRYSRDYTVTFLLQYCWWGLVVPLELPEQQKL